VQKALRAMEDDYEANGYPLGASIYHDQTIPNGTSIGHRSNCYWLVTICIEGKGNSNVNKISTDL